MRDKRERDSREKTELGDRYSLRWIVVVGQVPVPLTRADRERHVMPGKKHLHGVGAKEQREYEHIKESSERSGRYGYRAKEVAARTVMKQHKAKGHRKGQ